METLSVFYALYGEYMREPTGRGWNSLIKEPVMWSVDMPETLNTMAALMLSHWNGSIYTSRLNKACSSVIAFINNIDRGHAHAE